MWAGEPLLVVPDPPASDESDARLGAQNPDFILPSANDAFGVLKMLEPPRVERKTSYITSFLGCWCAGVDMEPE
jgi:hypothetical protein